MKCIHVFRMFAVMALAWVSSATLAVGEVIDVDPFMLFMVAVSHLPMMLAAVVWEAFRR